jgi:N-methylhydantoinase A
VRYRGQNYEISISVPDGSIASRTIADLSDAFFEAHTQTYGFAVENEPIEIVTVRLQARGIVNKLPLMPRPSSGSDASRALINRRDVWLPLYTRAVNCPIYDRMKLDAGNIVKGPAILEQMDSTTLVPPNCSARVDSHLNVILELM